MQWVYSDGGRAKDGFKGRAAGDCVTRAIAIAAELPYRQVYDAINVEAKRHRRGPKEIYMSSARTGVYRKHYERVLNHLGWIWTPTKKFGGPCHTHLQSDELPGGRIICRLSRHMIAVIDGICYDIYNPTHEGRQLVYGYYTKGHDNGL